LVLWGFMAFLALGAVMALAFSFDPDLRKQREMIWATAGGYLLGFAVATPALWKQGKRRAAEMVANDDAKGEADPTLPTSAYGRTVRRSSGQGIALCSITTAAGLLAL